MKEKERVRVNFNLPSDLVEQIKIYANELGINTTSAYTVLLKQALEQQSMLREMPKLINTLTDMKNNALDKDKTGR